MFKSDPVVVRVVYDGLPEAGKTTSIQALAGRLSEKRCGPFKSPGEVDGRTVLFDWLEYEGGLFEGRPVRVQIVTVPGHRAFRDRRKFLLSQADAVVFVMDSAPQRLDENHRAMLELEGWLGDEEPPVGVVFQANKRDIPGALALDQLSSILPKKLASTVIESIACDSSGVLEGFIFAVRLAVDRARHLLGQDRLEETRPTESSFEEFRDAVARHAVRPKTDVGHPPVQDQPPSSPATTQADETSFVEQEDDVPGSLVQLIEEQRGSHSTAQPPVATIPPDGSRRPPRGPDPGLASGLVYPPVAGRIAIRELDSGRRLPFRRDNSWSIEGGGRLAWSSDDLEFQQLEEGRFRLLDCARRYIKLSKTQALNRSLSLAPTGMNSWRIWELFGSGTPISGTVFGTGGHISAATAAHELTYILELIPEQPCSKFELAHIGVHLGDIVLSFPILTREGKLPREQRVMALSREISRRLIQTKANLGDPERQRLEDALIERVLVPSAPVENLETALTPWVSDRGI